jgi:dolichyl-phosphate beta-glucosyltransferase
VPAYNEASRIGATLPEVRRFLDQLGSSYEFIVSNDGSRDETVEIVTRFIRDWPQARLVGYAVNRGKGSALRIGVLATSGTRIIFMDADLSTPLDEIPKALALLDSGADVVIGSRSALGARVTQKQPRYRRWGAKLFNQIRDQLLGLGDLGDTQCGFKAFRGDVGRQLFAAQRIHRWMFDAEVLYIARRKRLRIIPMPVRWSDARGSKLRLFRDTAHMFRDLIRIRIWHRGQ